MESPIETIASRLVGLGRPRGPYRRRSLGPLHDQLSAGLPDLVSHGGTCNLYRLAETLGVSTAAVYAWMKDNRLTLKMANRIVGLSAKQRARPGFAPLTLERLLPFLKG